MTDEKRIYHRDDSSKYDPESAELNRQVNLACPVCRKVGLHVYSNGPAAFDPGTMLYLRNEKGDAEFVRNVGSLIYCPNCGTLEEEGEMRFIPPIAPEVEKT